ncbi:MAG: hypothetical protein KTR25_16145 [Myxococcales bacterium]|nr:hypothetical protein [Myxococcales bacterium]
MYHGYQLRLDPLDLDPKRSLHQFYVTVDGNAIQLGPNGEFDVAGSIRFDTDFGNGFNKDTPFGGDIQPLQTPDDIDVLLLYLDWHQVGGQRVDIRVGRQTQVDDLDWYVHDGIKLSAQLWGKSENRMDVQVYAGAPVRFDALFSSSDALVGDGTEVYDGSGLLGGLGVGGNIFLRLFRSLTLSLSARNELVFRDDTIEGFGNAVCVEPCDAGENSAELSPRGTQVIGSDEERALAAAASAGTIGLQESLVGASVGYHFRPASLNFQGSFAFNILTDHIDRVRAAISYDPALNFHLGAEYLRIRPRFLGDSIFNWFNIFSYDRLELEGNWSMMGNHLTLEAKSFFQFYRGDDQLSDGSQREDVIFGPGGGISWRDANYGIGAHIEAGTNPLGGQAFGGDYLVAWLAADVAMFDRVWVADGQISMTAVRNDWASPNSINLVDNEVERTWNLSFGSRFNITRWMQARVQVLYNINPILEGNYRIFSELVMVHQ